jgi:hypothetical protein
VPVRLRRASRAWRRRVLGQAKEMPQLEPEPVLALLQQELLVWPTPQVVRWALLVWRQPLREPALVQVRRRALFSPTASRSGLAFLRPSQAGQRTDERMMPSVFSTVAAVSMEAFAACLRPSCRAPGHTATADHFN